METFAQFVGEQRFVVDCKVNPLLFVGHVNVIEPGATLTVRAGFARDTFVG
jgi:hypothetical protein